MTLTLDNRSQNKESSLTQALRLLQQLNSNVQAGCWFVFQEFWVALC
ncbi:hypothetical protein [Nostoc sp. S13]|nr:hypothetical protein [Nostoc sp. S13]MDF5739096.1 hypothetical protein [Nostoc sp. S13]